MRHGRVLFLLALPGPAYAKDSTHYEPGEARADAPLPNAQTLAGVMSSLRGAVLKQACGPGKATDKGLRDRRIKAGSCSRQRQTAGVVTDSFALSCTDMAARRKAGVDVDVDVTGEHLTRPREVGTSCGAGGASINANCNAAIAAGLWG